MAASRRFGIDASTIVDTEVVSAPMPGLAGVEAEARAEVPARTFLIIRTTQLDPYQSAEPAALEAREARARAGGDVFGGTARAVAKIKILRVAMEEFADLASLLASLPSDAQMTRQNIPNDRSSDRVSDERRNVRVSAFLWAAKREGDNDYHIIIGRAGRKPTRFMNAEISGLPPTRTRDTPRLRAVRKAFEDVVRPTRLGLPGTNGYDFYKPPFPIVIEGSLFFDVAHNSVGPQDARPKSVWEIHPISSIEFIDDGADHESFRDLDEATILDIAEFPGDAPRRVVRTNQRDPGDS